MNYKIDRQDKYFQGFIWSGKKVYIYLWCKTKKGNYE